VGVKPTLINPFGIEKDKLFNNIKMPAWPAIALRTVASEAIVALRCQGVKPDWVQLFIKLRYAKPIAFATERIDISCQHGIVVHGFASVIDCARINNKDVSMLPLDHITLEFSTAHKLTHPVIHVWTFTVDSNFD
jgi:hypothetical protein